MTNATSDNLDPIEGFGESLPPHWNIITSDVLSSAIAVHRALGPGLPERVYEQALEYELKSRNRKVDRQRRVQLTYKGLLLDPLVLDLVIDDLVVLELKSIDKVADVHLFQLVSYLIAAKLPLGLLLNFNVPLMKLGIYRRLNKLALPPGCRF